MTDQELKQWVADRLKYFILKDAEANDNYEKTYLYVYELKSIKEFNRFLCWCPKKNRLIVENDPYGGDAYWFVVDSCSISKRSPMAGGRIQLEVTLKLRLLANVPQQLAAPWELPSFNFRMSSATNEESTTIFYPGISVEAGAGRDGESVFWDDIWYGGEGNEDADQYGNTDTPKPFINTAGVMLEGTATFPTTQMSFSYCASQSDFESYQELFWALPGTINSEALTICGFNFAPRVLKIESLTAEYCELLKAGIKDGSDAEINYHYYRIDASFTINPRTWNQRFLNVGTHVNRNGAIQRVWSWNDADGHPVWGTYADYRMAGGVNGESVSEPLALNADGDGVMGIGSDGRMIMSYRVGSTFRPVRFSELAEYGGGTLAFRSAPPIKWNFG